MCRELFLITALVVVFSGSANAESVAQVFESFDLIGTWAEHCDASPSDSNWYVEYAALPSGHVARRHFKGAESSFEYDVYDAKVSRDRISFSMENVDPRHRQFSVELLKRDNAIRVWDSTNEYGHSQVLNGVAIDTKIATPWLKKCR